MVFRVPRDHDGKGVVCPSCRRMLRLTSEQDAPSQVVPESRHRIEVSSAEGTSLKRKSTHTGLSHRHKLLISSALGLSLLGTVAILAWFRSASPKSIGIPHGMPPAAARMVELPAPELQKPPVTHEVLVSNNPALLKETVQLAEKFLNAHSVGALLPLVYHPEISESRIRAYYNEGGKFTQGFTVIGLPTTPDPLKPLLLCEVRDQNLDTRNLSVHLTPAGPRVDWESWTAWSESSWNDFRNSRPTTPKLFRVKVSPVNYYNFDFKEETEWQSYTISSADDSETVYGYVPRNSPLDLLLGATVRGADTPLTLLLSYPANGQSSSQVIIDSLVQDNWTEKN